MLKLLAIYLGNISMEHSEEVEAADRSNDRERR